MEYDDDARAFNFLTGLICGAAIGAGAALLMAPTTGKKARKRLTRGAEDLKDRATDGWEELADDVRDRVDDALATARKRFS